MTALERVNGRRVIVPLVGAVAIGAFLFGTALAVGVFPGLGSDSQGPARQLGTVQFEETAGECGLSYETVGDSEGAGDGAVAVADYDRDGYPDILAVGGAQPVLFRNTGGEGSGGFERSGALPSRPYQELKSALFFDADGDGWEDLLLIPRSGEPIFLENDAGTYREADAGFETELQWATGAAAGDYDRDGDLDVFVVQNGNWSADPPSRGSSGEARDGYRNYLFENTNDGFVLRNDSGVAGSRWSLATSVVDLTGDGYPDIHVANDFGYDSLYVNDGDGSFSRRQLDGTNRHGMASMVRDVDGDGRLDLFVTNIEFDDPGNVWKLDRMNVRNRGNNLLVNQGNGTFVDRATSYGVRAGGWGWAGTIVDFDNDGALELVHTTKYYLERTRDGAFETTETRPSVWEGTENGTFQTHNASEAGFVRSNGRGLATLDFDRDGDLDVVVADTSDSFKLYETTDTDGNWLQVRVRRSDRLAIGARVTVETSDGSTMRVQSSRTNFFAQSTRTLQFGLGDATVQRIHVRWPDGTERTFTDIEGNQLVVLGKNGLLRSDSGQSLGC